MAPFTEFFLALFVLASTTRKSICFSGPFANCRSRLRHPRPSFALVHAEPNKAKPNRLPLSEAPLNRTERDNAKPVAIELILWIARRWAIALSLFVAVVLLKLGFGDLQVSFNGSTPLVGNWPFLLAIFGVMATYPGGVAVLDMAVNNQIREERRDTREERRERRERRYEMREIKREIKEIKSEQRFALLFDKNLVVYVKDLEDELLDLNKQKDFCNR